MQPILSFAALAVAAIFYTWRAWQMNCRRHRVLRARVAYMLWVMATEDEKEVLGVN